MLSVVIVRDFVGFAAFNAVCGTPASADVAEDLRVFDLREFAVVCGGCKSSCVLM